jgi:hypothetical protein
MSEDKNPEGKPFWKSKRFYATLLTAVLPLVPPIADFAAKYPEMYSAILAAVFGWVGLKTTEPVRLKMK